MGLKCGQTGLKCLCLCPRINPTMLWPLDRDVNWKECHCLNCRDKDHFTLSNFNNLENKTESLFFTLEADSKYQNSYPKSLKKFRNRSFLENELCVNR